MKTCGIENKSKTKYKSWSLLGLIGAYWQNPLKTTYFLPPLNIRRSPKPKIKKPQKVNSEAKIMVAGPGFEPGTYGL